jgi:hypothetical protein
MGIKNHLNMLSMVLKQKNKIEVALKVQQRIIFDGCII